MLARGKSWPPALLTWEKLISCSPAQEESGCPPAHFPLSRTKLRDEAEQQGLLRAWQSQLPPVLTLAWLMSSSMRSCSWPAEALRMACMFSFSTHSCCRSHLQDSQVTPRAPAHAEVPHRPSGSHKTPLPPKYEEKPHIYSFNPHGPLGLPLPFYPIQALWRLPNPPPIIGDASNVQLLTLYAPQSPSLPPFIPSGSPHELKPLTTTPQALWGPPNPQPPVRGSSDIPLPPL